MRWVFSFINTFKTVGGVGAFDDFQKKKEKEYKPQLKHWQQEWWKTPDIFYILATPAGRDFHIQILYSVHHR